MKTTIRKFLQDEQGQTATEYMLIVSVIVIGIVAAAYSIFPSFQSGVQMIGRDFMSIADTGKIFEGASGNRR